MLLFPQFSSGIGWMFGFEEENIGLWPSNWPKEAAFGQ